jgi:LysM repeat protein
MKPSFLSTRRHNTKKHPVGLSLRAVTQRRKKQRVAATASHGDFDYDDDYDSGSRITRVLTIIFFIHVVAIGLIFVHHYYLKRGLPAGAVAHQAAVTAPAAEGAPAASEPSARRLSTGDAPYIVARGDNYARIATAHEVSEADLRAANDNAEIRPGLLLKIPPKRIVAIEPPEVAAIRNPAATAPEADAATDGLIAVIDPADRTAAATQPAIPRATPVAGSGRVHVVQAGETIWRISQQYNVNQDALMKANNITDPRRIRAGQQLQIP